MRPSDICQCWQQQQQQHQNVCNTPPGSQTWHLVETLLLLRSSGKSFNQIQQQQQQREPCATSNI